MQTFILESLSLAIDLVFLQVSSINISTFLVKLCNVFYNKRKSNHRRPAYAMRIRIHMPLTS